MKRRHRSAPDSCVDCKALGCRGRSALRYIVNGTMCADTPSRRPTARNAATLKQNTTTLNEWDPSSIGRARNNVGKSVWQFLPVPCSLATFAVCSVARLHITPTLLDFSVYSDQTKHAACGVTRATSQATVRPFGGSGSLAVSSKPLLF